ncbi:MAG: PRC-barrel domain-containing protein [Methylobacteriaceae bacterium]|nr:PRC-barrel domain-containing protein [Methylobacteriaceae bacterium]
MNTKWLGMATAVAICAAAPAFTATNPPPTDPSKTGDVLTKESPDQWRASKLPGISIYGSDNKNIATVHDVLVGHDGKAEYVVLAAGGFLGIGKKLVAVPFTAVTFTDKRIEPPPAANPPAGATGTAPGAAPGTAAAPAASNPPPPPIAYPDHGTVNMTAEQFKSAPDFKYAD